MSQHDYVIDNAPGGTVRADINNALAAIVGNNSGASAPGTTYAYMFWADTTTGKLKQRNAANSAWIEILPSMASAYGGLLAEALLTTRGDIITRGASAAQRLAVGGANTVLRSDGTDPAWGKVTGAHIALGSDAQGDVMYYNGSAWARLAAGTSGYVLKTQGAGANPIWDAAAGGLTAGTPVSINGATAADFTGLPATVKLIVVLYGTLSLSGTDNYLVQIGDSGGIETTSYVAASSNDAGSDATSTAGFVIRNGTAANVSKGGMIIANLTGNQWVAFGVGDHDGDEGLHYAGVKTLSGTLDRVRFTRSGTDTFDGGAGTVNILYI